MTVPSPQTHPSPRKVWLLGAALVGLALLLSAAGVAIGSTGLDSLVALHADPVAWQIVWDIRLPRTWGAWAAGALLGLASTALVLAGAFTGEGLVGDFLAGLAAALGLALGAFLAAAAFAGAALFPFAGLVLLAAAALAGRGFGAGATAGFFLLDAFLVAIYLRTSQDCGIPRTSGRGM